MYRHLVSPVLAVLSVVPGITAWAQQQQPDAGALLREVERRSAPPLPAATPAVITAPAPAPAASGVSVNVTAYRLTGVTLVPESDLQTALAPFTRRRLTFAEMQKAADAVAAVYRERGYLVRAFLPEQNLAAGVVQIAVVEGRLAELRVDLPQGGGTRVRESTIRRFVLARQQLNQPIRADELQRGVNLLNDLPGFQADLLLEPAAREGESRAVVRVQDEPLIAGTVLADNAGVRSTGQARLLGSVALNGALGLGDQASVMALKTRGSDYARVAGSLPLGGDGLRAGAQASALNYQYDANNTRFEGTAQITGLSLSYPIRRGNDWNLNVAATSDAKRFRNTIGGAEVNHKRALVHTLGLTADARDGLFGGGLMQTGLALSSGRLSLHRNATDAAVDANAAGPQRAGRFDKWQWNLSRLQRVTARHTGWLALSGQQARKNLDSSEKFGIGGPSGVRAYAAGEASGDEGWLMNAEWRWQPRQTLQLVGFYDRGGVKRDRIPFGATQSPNNGVLAGAGVGLDWFARAGVAVHASVAWRVGSNPFADATTGQDSDGSKRNPRLSLTVAKSF